jgi:transcriptional regulator GlxA family with amidase domain
VRIAIYAFDGVPMFHLSVPQMVFDEVARQGLASWETVVFSDHEGAVRTAEGFSLSGVQGPAVVGDAEVVVVPSWFEDGRAVPGVLRRVLTQAHAGGATIAGLCLGALAVADAGLLTGRRAVTHWQAAEVFASRHPAVQLDAAALYIDHGDVLTSAGTASAIDACLHLVRTRLGAAAANTLARHLVVAPHREGGQAQYIDRPLPTSSADARISDVMEWATRNLSEDLNLDRLSKTAHMSRRSFVRIFRATTGVTPATWVRARRLDEARRLLETTTLSVDQIAASCGFGSTVTLRQTFASTFDTSPSAYRRRFDART